MAKTVSEIKKEMTDAFIGNETVATAYGLNAGETFDQSFSKVSIESVLFDVVAVSVWSLSVLFDTLKTEVQDIIDRLKAHTLRWYVEKAKAFQFGFVLHPDTDKYDNTGLTDAQIEVMQVIKYAACTRQRRENTGKLFLRLKVAGEENGGIGQLAEDKRAALEDYMFRVSDAGVDVDVVALPADSLKMKWTIYYDPLVLNADGSRLDGTDNEPVRSAIVNYTEVLLFNGTYVPVYHVDRVQLVEGVVIPVITECQTRYGARAYTSVSTKYEPDGGYLKFYNAEDLVIEYIPQTEIR